MADSGETILKVENLCKKFGKQDVLKGITLEINSGEIFGIIGSSGAGKSTLLNMLIGFVQPSSGQILFKNPHLLTYSEGGEDVNQYQDVLTHPNDVKKLFGFAAQRPSVYAKLSLVENLDLFGSLYNVSGDARTTNAKILLKLMGLYDFRRSLAEQLSGGMMKRLDIACALIHDPKILILDEPTADLDPYLRKQMWYLIRKINSKGTTIILSSHFLDELEDLCDRIGIIHAGKMEHYGTPLQLKKLHDSGVSLHVSTVYGRYRDLLDLLSKHKKRLRILSMNDLGHELVIHSHKPIEVVKDLVYLAKKTRDPILDLRMNKSTLNEVFEHIVSYKDDERAAPIDGAEIDKENLQSGDGAEQSNESSKSSGKTHKDHNTSKSIQGKSQNKSNVASKSQSASEDTSETVSVKSLVEIKTEKNDIKKEKHVTVPKPKHGVHKIRRGIGWFTRK